MKKKQLIYHSEKKIQWEYCIYFINNKRILIGLAERFTPMGKLVELRFYF